MCQEYIELRGARENNLKNVSLRIPKRKITIFTGVSGSGKSSIVFDTIATESQRLLNENFCMFVRNFLPKYSQPDADAIENLSMSIVVDQKRMGGGSHSTVGTITDINTILRMMFSRIGQPYVGPTNVFGFNDPQGMCPNCNGLGRKLDVDLDKFLDKSRSLNEGAILFPEYAVDSWSWSNLINTGLFDPDKKVSKYTQKELNELLNKSMSSGQTRIDRLAGALRIDKGVIRTDDLKATAPSADMTGKGSADLTNWNLDLALAIRLTAEADLPAFGLTLTGPLDRPKRTLDATALIGRLEQRASDSSRRRAAEASPLPPNTIVVPVQPAPVR